MPLSVTHVKILSSWTEGHLTGKLRRARRCEIVGGSGGSASDPLPAQAFMLTQVKEASPLVYGANQKVFLTCINNDETGVLIVPDTSISTMTPTSVSFSESTKGVITVKGI